MVLEDEFSAFALPQWRVLVRAGVLLGLDLHDSEDLAQATLLRCYVKWRYVQRADDRDAYVARVLLNLHRQSRRRRWWGESPVAVVPDLVTPDGAEAADDTETVRRALAHLSTEQREVVLLRIHLQLSERDTAGALGVAPGTVKSRLSRALARLAVDPDLIDLQRGGDT